MRRFVADHKAGVIWTVAIILLVIVFIILAFVYRWEWTGFFSYTTPKSETVEFHPGKSLWDLMGLLIIPLVLVLGGFLLNRAQRQSEQKIAQDQRDQDREIAKEREEERALQSYLDAMTALFLKERLRESEANSEVRSVARARTLTVLRGLNKVRKASVLRFLYESKLIDAENSVIDLSNADLGKVELSPDELSEVSLSEAYIINAALSGANLIDADLSEAHLDKADLSEADLRGADLRWAYMRGANLSGAFLSDANLSGANLSGADLGVASVSRADLRKADLYGADLSEAKYNTEPFEDIFRTTYQPTQWPDDFDPVAAGAIDVSKAGE